MILYTTKEAAKELGISAISVRRKVKAGEIPHRRLGGLIRFTIEDLAEYLHSTKVPARLPAREAGHE